MLLGTQFVKRQRDGQTDGQTHYIHVGMTAALTGRYSLPGRQALLGAQAWVEDTNHAGGIWLHGSRVQMLLRLTSYDDASEPEQCAALTERLLIEDQVDILLGPYSSGLALRAAEVAQRSQRVLWNHGGASEAIYTRGFAWVVGILSPPSTYFHSVLDFVRHTRPSASHVAIVHSTAGAFPQDVAAGAAQYCQQQGFETVNTYPYPAGTTDFAPILKQLERTAPAVVLSVGRIEDDLYFATQYLQCTMPADVVGLIVTPLTLFRDTLGNAAAHFVGPSQWEPAMVTEPAYGPSSEEVLTRLMARHPEGVDYPMAQAYAGGLVAQRCLEIAGTLNQHALRQVASTLDMTTFYGRYRIDPRTGRQLGHRMPVIQWQGGHKVVIWPIAAGARAGLYSGCS
jgi:branched-chain amino acid transport system substrate-binding protein